MEKADGGDFEKVTQIPSMVIDGVSALQRKSVGALWGFFGWAGIACQVAGVETDYLTFRDMDPVFALYTPVVIANNTFLKEYPKKAAEILMTAAPALRSHEQPMIESRKYLAKEYISDSGRWGEIDSGSRSRYCFPPIPASKTDFFLSNITPCPVFPFSSRDDKYRRFFF